MSAVASKVQTQDIVIDEVFPHTVATIWKALTSAQSIARWLMPPTGFEAIEGNVFTFKTNPAGAWDGTIHCRVLEVVPNQRFAYAWKGGDESNTGYGSALDTVVTWSLGGRSRHARSRGAFRLRDAEERYRLPQHE